MYPAYQTQALDYDNPIKKQEIAFLEKKYTNVQEMQYQQASAEATQATGSLQRTLIFNYGCMQEIQLAYSEIIRTSPHNREQNPGNMAYTRGDLLHHNAVNDPDTLQHTLNKGRLALASYEKLLATAGDLNGLVQQFSSYMNTLPLGQINSLHNMIMQSINLYQEIENEAMKVQQYLQFDQGARGVAASLQGKNRETASKVMRLYSPYLLDTLKRYSPLTTSVRMPTANSNMGDSNPSMGQSTYNLNNGVHHQGYI